MLKIGLKYAEKCHEKYWIVYEIIGICYDINLGSHPDWKSKEDVLNDTPRKFQVITLPFPNEFGLPSYYQDMKNSQLSVFLISEKHLLKKIEVDSKLRPNLRKIKILKND